MGNIEKLFDRINEKLADWFMVFFSDPDYLLQTEAVYADVYSPDMTENAVVLSNDKAVEVWFKVEKIVVLAALFLKDLYGTLVKGISVLTGYAIEKGTSVKIPAGYKIKTSEFVQFLHNKKKQAWSFLTNRKDDIQAYISNRYTTMRSFARSLTGIQIKLHWHPA